MSFITRVLDADHETQKYLWLRLAEVRCPKCHKRGNILVNINADEHGIWITPMIHHESKYHERRDEMKVCMLKLDEELMKPSLSSKEAKLHGKYEVTRTATLY